MTVGMSIPTKNAQEAVPVNFGLTLTPFLMKTVVPAQGLGGGHDAKEHMAE
jgi:hypothetical protein